MAKLAARHRAVRRRRAGRARRARARLRGHPRRAARRAPGRGLVMTRAPARPRRRGGRSRPCSRAVPRPARSVVRAPLPRARRAVARPRDRAARPRPVLHALRGRRARAVLVAVRGHRPRAGRRHPGRPHAGALPSIRAALAGEPRRSSGSGCARARCSGSTSSRSANRCRDHARDARDPRHQAEEKALQHSLEEQRGFLSAVLTQLGERVIVCDADGAIVDFGGAHLRPDGRTAPARMGRVLRPHASGRSAVRTARGAAAACAAR